MRIRTRLLLAPRKLGRRALISPRHLTALGWILGPIIGGYFVFSGSEEVNSNAGLSTPYVGIGLFVLLLLIVFAVSRVPDLHVEDESHGCRHSSKPSKTVKHSISSGSLLMLALVCGLLYFFIAPILAMVWLCFT